jgi:hypothetical protein
MPARNSREDGQERAFRRMQNDARSLKTRGIDLDATVGFAQVIRRGGKLLLCESNSFASCGYSINKVSQQCRSPLLKYAKITFSGLSIYSLQWSMVFHFLNVPSFLNGNHKAIKAPSALHLLHEIACRKVPRPWPLGIWTISGCIQWGHHAHLSHECILVPSENQGISS